MRSVRSLPAPLFAALLAGVGGTGPAQVSSPPSTLVPEPQPVRILPLGDSITVGLPDTGGWRAPLFERLEANLFDVDFVGSAPPFSDPALIDDWHHEGHNGWTLAHLTEYPGGPGAPASTIEDWLELFDPAVILLHAGTNDLGIEQLEPTQAAKRLQKLLLRIYDHSPTVHVVLARIVPLAPGFYDWKWAQFNQGVDYLADQAQAAGFSLTVADMFGAFVSHPNRAALYLDPVHPNQAGYDVMADVWYDAVADLVQSLGAAPENPPLVPPPVVQHVTESPVDGAFTAATDDLIDAGSPTLAGVAHVGYSGGAAHPAEALNDGDSGPGAPLAMDPLDERWTSTFALDLSASPSGYDIHSVRGFDFAGGPPGSGGFGAQAFTIWLETVQEPGVFKLLGFYRYAYSTGALAPPTGGSGLVRIVRPGGPLATGISAIRFRFTPDPGLNAYTAYTEIDVLGAPTAAGH